MRTATAALVLAALTASAQADIVELSYAGRGRGQNVHVTAGAREMNTFAGQLLIDITAGTGLGEQLVGLNTLYCVDVTAHMPKEPSEFAIVPLTEVPDSRPMTAAAAGAMASMFAGAAGAQFESDAPAAYAAAFQLAVWEIASDFDPQLGLSSLDLSSGWFHAEGFGETELPAAVADYAADLFAAAASAEQYDGWLFALRSDRYQDQIGARAVPTPGPTAMLSLGIALAAGRRRR